MFEKENVPCSDTVLEAVKAIKEHKVHGSKLKAQG